MRLPAVDNLLFANVEGLQIVDPFLSDSRAGMMLLIPQELGADLNDVVIETRDDGEWVRFGSYLYRPSENIPTLASGTVSIDTEGLAEWRSINATRPKTITVTPVIAGGYWRIYNSDFQLTKTVVGAKSESLSGDTYYLLFHSTANVNWR